MSSNPSQKRGRAPWKSEGAKPSPKNMIMLVGDYDPGNPDHNFVLGGMILNGEDFVFLESHDRDR